MFEPEHYTSDVADISKDIDIDNWMIKQLCDKNIKTCNLKYYENYHI